jgi:hypothetical protein
MYQVSSFIFLVQMLLFLVPKFWIKMHVIKVFPVARLSLLHRHLLKLVGDIIEPSPAYVCLLSTVCQYYGKITCFTVPAIAYHIHTFRMVPSLPGTALARNGSQSVSYFVYIITYVDSVSMLTAFFTILSAAVTLVVLTASAATTFERH